MAGVRSPPLGRRFEQTMAMNAHREAENHDEEPAWRKEVLEMVQRRYPPTGCETNNTHNPGYYASVTNMWRPSEFLQLNTEPPPREIRSVQAMPNPPFLASEVEMPASHEKLPVPVTPSADATTAELQAHIETLEERLGAAEVRIENLQKQHGDSQRAYVQAIYEGQEVELARLRRTNNALKRLLDEAQNDREELQKELRESRAREADSDQQLHRINLEHAPVLAEAEQLRKYEGTHQSATVPWTVRRSQFEDCLHQAHRTRALDEEESTEYMPKSSRRRRGTGGGWDLPKGQANWKSWLP